MMFSLPVMTVLCQKSVHGAREMTRQLESACCSRGLLELGYSTHISDSQSPCNSVTPAPGDLTQVSFSEGTCMDLCMRYRQTYTFRTSL